MTSIKEWRSFAGRVGILAYSIVHSAEHKLKSNFTKEQLVAIALLARTASNLKGVLVLLDQKLIVEARTIARSCFENQYWVLALVEEGESFARKMISDDTTRKLQRGQSMFASLLKFEVEVEANLRKWMKDHKNHDGEGLTPKQVAQLGAAKNTYVFYGILSCDAHPSIDTLDRYFTKIEDGNDIAGLHMDPPVSDDEIMDTLNLTCLAVLGLCSGVDEIFGGTKAGERLTQMGEEYKALTKKKPNSTSELNQS